MDASLTLMTVSVFSGIYALWSLWEAKRESARLDREQGITPAAKPARKA